MAPRLFYRCPGMMYPYWSVSDGIAHNLDADTDMGDLTEEEFHQYFPAAEEVTEHEAMKEVTNE